MIFGKMVTLGYHFLCLKNFKNKTVIILYLNLDDTET